MAQKLEYNPPTIEVVDANEEGSARYRLPYGLAKGLGLSTEGMTPREVWEMLKGHGVTPENEYDKLKEKAQKEVKKEEPKVANVQKDLALKSDRMQYNKRLTEKRVKDLWEAGTEEMQEVTCRLFNDDSFGIGKAPTGRKTAFFGAYNKVGYMEQDDGGESSYSKGGVWYHEIWHAIDGNYRVIEQQELDEAISRVKKALPSFSDENAKRVAIRKLSQSYLSDSYKLKSGKTLYETLVNEMMAKISVSEVVKTHKEEVEAYYKGKGYNRASILEKKQEMDKESDRIYNEVYERTKSYYDAINARKEYRETEENKKLIKDYEFVKSDNPAAVTRKWGDFSDVISGATMDRVNFGMHHERSYWRSNKYLRAHEFFAECASAKSTNPESYELMKHYLPDSVNGFEELYDKLKRGEIKSNGREKWQP